MAYAELPDLIARFGEAELAQVADTDGTGEIDPALVGRALGDADAEIDAALVGRYALPITPVPELLTRIACDLARESLYADQPTKVVEDRAKRSRELLAQIARGVMRLVADAAPAEESGLGLVEIVSGRRTSPFTGG
jgi:phage gp36-like protein